MECRRTRADGYSVANADVIGHESLEPIDMTPLNQIACGKDLANGVDLIYPDFRNSQSNHSGIIFLYHAIVSASPSSRSIFGS